MPHRPKDPAVIPRSVAEQGARPWLSSHFYPEEMINPQREGDIHLPSLLENFEIGRDDATFKNALEIPDFLRSLIQQMSDVLQTEATEQAPALEVTRPQPSTDPSERREGIQSSVTDVRTDPVDALMEVLFRLQSPEGPGRQGPLGQAKSRRLMSDAMVSPQGSTEIHGQPRSGVSVTSPANLPDVESVRRPTMRSEVPETTQDYPWWTKLVPGGWNPKRPPERGSMRYRR